MRELNDVTVAIKTFYRTEKLKNALASLIGIGVKKVIVTDDGKITPQKQRIYDKFKKLLPLEVIKLPYDSGIGYCRKVAVESTTTPYLLIMDDDMEAPPNLYILKEILESNKTLGGVAGCWVEYGKFRCTAHNLKYSGGYIIRYDPSDLTLKYVKNVPYIVFDFIPNSAMFRLETLDDYNWDENYVIGYEHLDFYWGHKKLGKWKFAVTPSVLFMHYPGGSSQYLSERFSKKKLKESKAYFLKKWGVKGIVSYNEDFGRANFRQQLVVEIRKHLPNWFVGNYL